MSEIKLSRVDFRLMHGQVVTGWLNHVSADTILIVNNELASDPFLSQVFFMAVPPGIKLIIESIDDAVVSIKEKKYSTQKILVLFKTITDAYKAIVAGFPIDALQVGGVDDGPNKKRIGDVLCIDDSEIEMLKEIEQKGVTTTFQVTSRHNPISLENALKAIK